MNAAVPELYRHDQFLARRQVFRLFGGGFTLSTLEGAPLAASELKAFRLKEDIRVRDGVEGGEEILVIQADSVIDFSAAYKVRDARTGEAIGSLRRKGWTSMFRDSWEILDTEGVVRGKVTEDSGWKAIVRRMHDGIAMFMPQTFHILVNDRVIGEMAQSFNPFVQKYRGDLSLDTEALLPRPLAVATVILLLAIEGRQG